MARKGYDNKRIYAIDFFNIERDKKTIKDKYGYPKQVDKLTDIDNKLFVGFDLGSDFTSEHEHGIKRLISAFGVKYENNDGIEGLRNTHIPDRIHFGKRMASRTRRSFWILSYGCPIDGYGARDIISDYTENETFHSGWSEDSFLIAVPAENKQAANELRQLYKAIKKKKMVFLMGASKFISNRGLFLAIHDRIPLAVDQHIKQSQEDQRVMESYVEKLDIKDRLREKAEEWQKANPLIDKDAWWNPSPWCWMALSPRKISPHSEKTSAHPYWFLLNPHNQQHVNFGHFTVEELEQWIECKGPIPMDNFMELVNQTPPEPKPSDATTTREAIQLKTTR